MIGKTDGHITRRLSACLRLVVVTLLAGSIFTLAGCEDKPVTEGIDQHAVETRRSLDAIQVESPSKHYNPLIVTDKVWAGSTALRMQRGLPLPPRYETPRGITLVSADPMSMADIANAITAQTGVTVRINQTGLAGANGQGGQATAAPVMPVAYEGPLSGLLERVAGHFGINWHYDGAAIEISRYETRVFVIEALPGTLKVEEGMQDASAGTAVGASASAATTQQSTITQNSKTSIDIKYWEELGQTLTSMLGGNGTVIMSPSLGIATVTTTPEIMRSVAQYIAIENQRLSRQIAINVEIYVVQLQNGMDFDIAFSTALQKLSKDFITNFAGVGVPTTVSGFTGAGNMSVAILDPNNNVQEVKDIFTAISGLGNATTVAKFPLVTINNRPVSRRIGQQVSYVASTATTVAGTSGTATTALTPGTVPEGFTVQITPRVLDDGRILMEYSLSDISITSIVTFNSQCGTASSSTCTAGAGSTSVQSPNSVERIFVQQSVLKSGSTLILGGAEEEDLSQNAQGVGDPNFYALGGGISSNKTHTMIFFAVTPQVLDVPHTEQE